MSTDPPLTIQNVCTCTCIYMCKLFLMLQHWFAVLCTCTYIVHVHVLYMYTHVYIRRRQTRIYMYTCTFIWAHYMHPHEYPQHSLPCAHCICTTCTQGTLLCFYMYITCVGVVLYGVRCTCIICIHTRVLLYVCVALSPSLVNTVLLAFACSCVYSPPQCFLFPKHSAETCTCTCLMNTHMTNCFVVLYTQKYGTCTFVHVGIQPMHY